MGQEKEIKIQRANDSPIIAGADSRLIEGYALKFDKPSELMYDWQRECTYTENIARGAVTEDIIKKSDVICYLDHNPNKMLARSRFGEGTLKLEIDEIGLKYSFEAPNTAAGDEALELIRRKDITGSSFYANVKRENMSWTINGKKGVCTINRFTQFFDVSPVQRPAYECTEAVVRAMAEDIVKGPEPKPAYQKPKTRFHNF
ncbi:MAG: HK97 family phage prohead protease [Tannerellaceae bacterium]